MGGVGERPDPASSGIRAAAARAERYGRQLHIVAVEPTVNLLVEVLRDRPEPVADGTVEFAVETAALGAAYRSDSGGDPMTRGDLETLVENVAWLLGPWLGSRR